MQNSKNSTEDGNLLSLCPNIIGKFVVCFRLRPGHVTVHWMVLFFFSDEQKTTNEDEIRLWQSSQDSKARDQADVVSSTSTVHMEIEDHLELVVLRSPTYDFVLHPHVIVDLLLVFDTTKLGNQWKYWSVSRALIFVAHFPPRNDLIPLPVSSSPTISPHPIARLFRSSWKRFTEIYGR